MESLSGLEIKTKWYAVSVPPSNKGWVGTSVDIHPTEPWIIAGFETGWVRIWNYRTNTIVKEEKFSEFRVTSAKFMPCKQWVLVAIDKFFAMFDHTLTLVPQSSFVPHKQEIRCLAVHPTSPCMLSAEDNLIILSVFEEEWAISQTYAGHSQFVHVTFNSKNPNTFASASRDYSIKIWDIRSHSLTYTVDTDQIVTCIDFFTGESEPYIIAHSIDNTAKVWNYQANSLVRKVAGRVSVVCYHPELPIILTGSIDGDVRIWDSATFSLEQSVTNHNYGKVWAIGCLKGSRRVVIGYAKGIMMVKIGREEPAASMDNNGKVVWVKHKKIQTANVSLKSDHEASDGESLRLEIKELGTCDFYTQSLKRDPSGQFSVCGGGKFIITTDFASKRKRSSSALEIVWSPDGEYAAREATSRIKIYSKYFQEKKTIQPLFSAERICGGTLLAICSDFFCCFYDWAEGRLIQRIDVIVKNVYWADGSDQVAIISDKSFYILKFKQGVVSSYLDSMRTADEGVIDAFEILHKIDERVRTGIWVRTEILAEYCFIYNNSAWRLNYWVDGKVTTMFNLDRPMYLLGYLANERKVYLIDRDFNVTKYMLSLSLVEYKTLVLRDDLEQARQILPSIPEEQLNSVARFLELQGMIKAASEVATDPDYKFELATQLGKLKMAKDNKHIAWHIVVHGSIKKNIKKDNDVRYASGFTVKGDVSLGGGRELVILSCAEVFDQFELISAIKARRLDEKESRPANMIYKDNRLNLAALGAGLSSDDDYGVLAREGSIFPGECLFYLGNPVNFVGSHLVGTACFPCINDVFRILGCGCANYLSSVKQKTCNIRRMGDLYDRLDLKFNGKKEVSYESGIDAFVPIIQIAGLLHRDGVLGGPVFNSRGEIVGVLVSSFEKGFQIAVHVRAIDTFFRLLGAYYFKHVDKILT